jgi:hypothetical protein
VPDAFGIGAETMGKSEAEFEAESDAEEDATFAGSTLLVLSSALLSA